MCSEGSYAWAVLKSWTWGVRKARQSTPRSPAMAQGLVLGLTAEDPARPGRR